jgi:hypothetical protein
MCSLSRFHGPFSQVLEREVQRPAAYDGALIFAGWVFLSGVKFSGNLPGHKQEVRPLTKTILVASAGGVGDKERTKEVKVFHLAHETIEQAAR